MYEHKYILKTPHSKVSEATLLGSLLHAALEDFYLNRRASLLESFDSLDEFCLNSMGLGRGFSSSQLWKMMKSFAERTEELHFRASKNCKVNPIRKSNGDVAAKPKQTSAWQAASESLGLQALSADIASETMICFPDLPFDFSLGDVFSQARFLAKNFVPPAEIAEVLHVEFKINARPPEPHSDVDILGFIDLVARDSEGRLMIIDHKSWSEQTTEHFVRHNTQLHLYAFGFQQMTGEYPDFLAINELKTNRLILAPFDHSLMEILLERFFSLIPLTQQSTFPGHSPDTMYSPCFNQFNKPCPFLNHCWPGAA